VHNLALDHLNYSYASAETVREMTQLPKETQKDGDRQTKKHKLMNKQSTNLG